MKVQLGIVQAVTEYGDDWIHAPILTRGIACAILNEYRVSVREGNPEWQDAYVMRMATRYGRLHQEPLAWTPPTTDGR